MENCRPAVVLFITFYTIYLFSVGVVEIMMKVSSAAGKIMQLPLRICDVDQKGKYKKS